MSTGIDLPSRRPAVRRPELAGAGEVGRWALIAGAVAVVLLLGVAVVGTRVPGDAAVGLDSGLLAPHHRLGDALGIFRRNLLVLGIHLCACWIGAIVGRPHRPAPARLGRAGRLHRPVPEWMGRASLLYALLVTALSVVVQAIALGRELADISAATDLSRAHLLLLVLPHAVPELVAVFLPLGLFLREAGGGRLERLGPWSLQAAAIAVPLLFGAALVETWVTPPRVIASAHRAERTRAAEAPGPRAGAAREAYGRRRGSLRPAAGRMRPDAGPRAARGSA